MSNTILIILFVLALVGTVFFLVRGIVAFLQTTEADLKSGAEGPSASGLKQNRAMMNRIIMQALAVLILVILLLASRS